MIRQAFTITSIPFTVTVPGTGDMLPHLVTIGGMQVTEGIDFSRSLRTFSFPSTARPFNFTVLKAPDGNRRVFTTNRVFIIPLVFVSLNGTLLDPWLFQVLSNQSVQINTPEPPVIGDVIEMAGFSADSFTIGSVGEILEV